MTRVTNDKLKVDKDERQKIEEMIKRRKTKTMAIKRQEARERMSLSSKEERNYKDNIKDKTDLDQVYDKNLLQP